MKTPVDVADEKLFDNWFDPVETELRTKVRGLMEAMIEDELEIARPRYGRRSGLPVGDDVGAPIAGHRHGRRIRSLTGTFGRTEIAVPRARIFGADDKTTEWKSKVVRAYQRRTRAADALIASAYQAPDQNSDRSAIGRNSSHVVLGSAGFGADHNAQSRWLAKPQRKAFRSDH